MHHETRRDITHAILTALAFAGAACVVHLVLASVAWARPIILESFDAVDDGSTTATDLMALATLETATDADVRSTLCTSNSHRCHKDTNGGSSSSYWAGWVDLASGERGGWEQGTRTGLPSGQLTGTLAFSAHLPAVTTGAREIARWTMGVGGTQGCNVRLNADRSLTLYYAATSIGTSGGVLHTNACSTDALVGCAAGGDCVSGVCTTCSTTTGTGCYWPTIELVQQNFPTSTGDQVDCELWLNGVKEVDSGLIAAAGLSVLTGYEVGGPGTESVALQLAVDDIIVETAERAGKGYLHWMTPTAAKTGGVTESNCGTGTLYVRCVDDWVSGGTLTTTAVDNTFKATAVGRSIDLTRFATQPTSIPDGATIPAVMGIVVGRTASGTSGGTRTKLAQCSSAAANCESLTPAFDVAHGELTSMAVTGLPYAIAPPAGGGAWSLSGLATVGLTWTPSSLSGTLRGAAIGITAQVRLQDAPPVANLDDHNIGTDDGLTTVVIHGDSTACGTGASTCFGGSANTQACNQETHCSWDAANKSKPPGGCTSDTECRSCDGGVNRTRLEFANGAGYPCASDAACNLGTCSGGTCTGDTDVTCTTNDDCNLGACDETATCDDSCPGGDGVTTGICPARSGFPIFASFTSDTYLNCCQDGSTTGLVASAYFTPSLYGRASNCRLVWGDAGKCTCSSNSECQTTSGGTCTKSGGNGRCSTSIWTTCTVDGDCPGGETCLGLCTASDNGRDACTAPTTPSGGTTAQCATSRVCAFPPADYTLIATALNDMSPGQTNGDCTWPYTPNSGLDPCDNCTETLCVADSACSGISASSKCLGINQSATANQGCWGPFYGGLFQTGCSTYTAPCRNDGECPSGQTCTGETGGPQRDGLCTCGTCPSGFTCHASMCRRNCTTDAHCGTNGDCDEANSVCKGQCTCPCDSISCSVDADCPSKTVAFGTLYPSRKTSGQCVAGKCDNCGLNNCQPPAGTADHAYFVNYSRHYAGFRARALRAFQSTIDTEAARTSDATKPLLIPMTWPDATSRAQPTCEGGNWGDSQSASVSDAVQMRAEFAHVIDARRYVQDAPDSVVYVDQVHPGAVGGALWGRPIGEYLETLNSCRTGTGPESRLARYRKNADGTWHSPDTTCTVDGDWADSDTCAHRTCTVNDDTSSGCPGTPTCHLE